jgi:single-stranded-DNA-specific exonuclease
LAPVASPETVLAFGMPQLWATLLVSRGIRSAAEAQAFLSPDALSDPFLLSGMDRAVARVRAAIQTGERIAVYGDFDADGVTASALLASALKDLGGDTVPYLPHRTLEGHGLHIPALRSLKQQGVGLIITVDCGITAIDEVAAAQALGMDVVVTDHHVPGEAMPPALAVVSPLLDPSSPLAHFAGAGLAFKLAQALHLASSQPLPPALLEMAAIGTVADLTPLLGENRVLVHHGLRALRASASPGVLALAAQSSIRLDKLDAESLSFGLVPRINAAGRLGSPDLSFALLTAPDLAAAQPLAASLERLNRERQELTTRLVVSALPEAGQQAAEHALIFLARSDFLPGTNGLVASRLVDQYRRPSVVASMSDGIAVASARSVPGFNLADAFRRAQKGVRGVVRFGGHAAAAGFTAHTHALPELMSALRLEASRQLAGAVSTQVLHIDAEVPVRALLGDTFRFLERLGPFGVGNPTPLFLTRGVQLVGARRMGAQGQHLSMKLRHGQAIWDAVMFAQRDAAVPTPTSPWLDVVYAIGRDDRDGGDGRLRLMVRDFATAAR